MTTIYETSQILEQGAGYSARVTFDAQHNYYPMPSLCFLLVLVLVLPNAPHELVLFCPMETRENTTPSFGT